ncbi:TIGR00645 family protein [Stenotrophomonas sp. AB1(2024)]|uniref:TIGR00645 family protein n=1 Tax=Stenotrophomonas sp. AB1(2024) TaxID=3132215 RepID=UPI0030B468BF
MSSTAKPISPLSSLIFASRWLQLPLYLGLILAQCVYVFLFGKELWHLVHKANSMGEQEIMLLVLGLIDVVMISNLLVMVIVGGYETFVSRLRLENHPDQPEWLSHVNASVLKVKLALSIIGISSIHLLKTFIGAGNLDGLPSCNSPEYITTVLDAVAKYGPAVEASFKCSSMSASGVMWQTIIHAAFILSAIGIAYTDKLMAHTPSKALAH